jgi:hypothetical protein
VNIVYDLTYGDSLTPIGVQLKQRNSSGTLSPVDLSGKTVKALVVDADGAAAVAETTTGVVVADEDNGKVSYDFLAGASALAEGTYYLYFRVYSGTERDTYPTAEKGLKIKVHKHIV